METRHQTNSERRFRIKVDLHLTITSKLLTHLYQYFGVLLGCKQMPGYTGRTSMYDVHKFMDLGMDELGYFIEQIGLAALSFGVDPSDLTPVAQALGTLFGQRCAPPVSILGGSVPAELQAICLDETCSLAVNVTCGSYGPSVSPGSCNATLSHPTGGTNGTKPCPTSGSSGSGSGSGSAKPSSVVNGAATNALSIGAEVLAAVVLGFIL
jgi:hypothetical protein